MAGALPATPRLAPFDAPSSSPTAGTRLGNRIWNAAACDLTSKKQFLTRSHEEHEEKQVIISRLSSWLRVSHYLLWQTAPMALLSAAAFSKCGYPAEHA